MPVQITTGANIPNLEDRSKVRSEGILNADLECFSYIGGIGSKTTVVGPLGL